MVIYNKYQICNKKNIQEYTNSEKKTIYLREILFAEAKKVLLNIIMI